MLILATGISIGDNRVAVASSENTVGLRVTETTLNNAWRKIRIKLGYGNLWIHDIKKKAGTDGKDLGHMTK